MAAALTTRDESVREVTLPVTEMTCASCARRIEKALTKVGGIQAANVNLATEKARVVYEPSVVTFDAMKGTGSLFPGIGLQPPVASTI